MCIMATNPNLQQPLASVNKTFGDASLSYATTCKPHQTKAECQENMFSRRIQNVLVQFHAD